MGSSDRPAGWVPALPAGRSEELRQLVLEALGVGPLKAWEVPSAILPLVAGERARGWRADIREALCRTEGAGNVDATLVDIYWVNLCSRALDELVAAGRVAGHAGRYQRRDHDAR